MPRVDGALARKLDFGAMTTTLGLVRPGGVTLRLAARQDSRGPDKYRVLDERRRRAQIRARRLLDLDKDQG